jgi:glutaredoxin-related protein
MSDINAFIENEVKSNDVLLFMKGTPTFPQCDFIPGSSNKALNAFENAVSRRASCYSTGRPSRSST